MKLEISLDRELAVMAQYGLNGEEWMFLRVLFIAVEEEIPDYLQKYLLECAKKSSVRDLLNTLKAKKIISQKYKVPQVGEAFVIEDVEFHEPFINKTFKTSNSAGIELMRAYPPYLMMSNGVTVNLRNITTKGGYTDEDAFYFAYAKKIKFNPQTHEDVMKALQFGKDNGLLKYGIVEFVGSSKWIEISEVRDTGQVGNLATKLDTIEVV